MRIAKPMVYCLMEKFYEPIQIRQKRNWFQKLTEPRNYIQDRPRENSYTINSRRVEYASLILLGKLEYVSNLPILGLTGLMGIQVDPLFGHNREHERLYIRVANFGNEPIRSLRLEQGVFTFELHKVLGRCSSACRISKRRHLGRRIKTSR